MMRYSPLRYPGGKGKISSFFSELFVANNLIGGTYIEPYVGGGSIALSLLINGVANQIIINDKDRSLFAFWYLLFFHGIMLSFSLFCSNFDFFSLYGLTAFAVSPVSFRIF